jgi:DNA-binding NarL/FixJ family response regulator
MGGGFRTPMVATLPLRVLIVDDHAVVREGVAKALQSARGSSIITHAASSEEARARLASEGFDIAIVDIHLPDNSGLDLVLWIRELSQTMGVIVFSMNNHPEYILAAMDNGASGFLDKSAPISELVAMIDIVSINPLLFQCKDTQRALSYRRSQNPLTPRELEIVQLLPTGQTYAEMSEHLFISDSTLKTHLQSIYRKLTARNRMEAINEARRLGILPPIDPNSTAQ